MKIIPIGVTFVLTLASSAESAQQAPEVAWESLNDLGATNYNSSVAGTSDGGAWTAGSIVVSPGRQLHLARMDRAGAIVFEMTIPAAGSQFALPQLVNDGADGVFLCGTISSALSYGGTPLGGNDGLLIHLDAAGQTLWARRFGSDGNESGLAIARDPSGDVLVAGTTDGGYGGPVGVPGIHSFVTRFDANGNELWVARLEVTTFGPGHRRYVEGLAGDGAGRWTVTGWQTRPNDAFSGSFMAKVDGQGAVVDEGIHSIYCAHFHGSAPDGQGGDVVAATSYNGCAQASRYVFRVDSAGMVVWSTSLCSACTGYGVASDISADGAGGYFVSGTSADTSRPGVVHLDSQGVVDWRWSPPNSAHGILEGLSEVRGGSIFAAGTLAASTHRVLRIAIDPAGPTVCDGVPNSTGSAATAGYVGQEDRALNDVVFYANGLPAHAAGYFIVSQTAGTVPMAGGSQGTLCLGGSIGRLNRPGEVLSSSVDGRFHVAFDLDSIPQPLGTISATAGETWSFQAWYRDANPGSTSNFTSATSIVLH